MQMEKSKKTPEMTEQAFEPVEQSTNMPENIPDNSLSEISKLMSDYKEQASVTDEPIKEEKKGRGRPKKTEVKEQNNVINESSLITGSLFMLLINLIIPGLTAFIHNQFNKKNKIKSSQLALNKDQLEEIKPLADEAAKQIKLHADPMTLFIMALVGIYGVNYMMLINKD